MCLNDQHKNGYNRNYWAMAFEGSCFMGGIAIMSTSGTIALFINAMTGSKSLVGLAVTVQALFMFFGQLTSGPFVRSIRKIPEFLFKGMLIQRIIPLFMALPLLLGLIDWSVGIFLILSALSPFLIYIGVKLFNTEILKKKAIITVIVSTLVLLSLGIGILVPALTRTPVTNFSFTENVNNETPPSVHGNIRIENEGMYDLHVSMTDKTHTVKITVRVEHEDGEIMWETGGYDMFANKPTLLRTGIYNIIFIYETQSESIIPVEISFAIR